MLKRDQACKRGARLRMRLAVALCALAWLGVAPAGAQPVRLVDDRGTELNLPAPPRRIVSLLPSLTESVCAVGACERLVATDRWSNWPERVRRLPKVGGLDDVNVELIVAQRPDVVLAAPASHMATRLRALGLTVIELDAQDMAQAQRTMDTLARLVGRAEAGAVAWRKVQDEIEAARARVPAAARGLLVYFEVGNSPFAASESSFIGQLLTRLGARNVVPGAMGPFPKLNPEFVVRAQPELIMIAKEEAPALGARPGWRQLRAVQRQRVCAIDHAQYDLLARPGPRMGEGAMVLARCLADAVAMEGRSP